MRYKRLIIIVWRIKIVAGNPLTPPIISLSMRGNLVLQINQMNNY